MPVPPPPPPPTPSQLLTVSLVNTVHHPSFHPRSEKVRSNDAESAKPFKVETEVEPLFGSVLVQSSPPFVCVSVDVDARVCVCVFDG